ncbi:MAG: glutamate-5-semialdehyde dehydrogenase [Armatimonadota bacterium]
MDDVITALTQQAMDARVAAYELATISTAAKNQALLSMAKALVDAEPAILAANEADIAAARTNGLTEPMIERLTLDHKRILAMAEGMEQVASLPDPVGEIVSGSVRPNGLRIQQVRSPLGVIGIIYESRPNVTADAAALCLKSGNAVILRGGKEAYNSNKSITDVLTAAIKSAGLPECSVQMVQTTDRAATTGLMRMTKWVDCIIPRGGAGLINHVVQNSTVPVIETGAGNCHTYIHDDADLKMALDIAVNAKCQRPSVCNSMETLLVHSRIAEFYLPLLADVMAEKGVELRGCERTMTYIPSAVPATEEDWATEYNALILAVKIVDNVHEAVAHINKYGTRHSETIVTKSLKHSQIFTRGIDAAAVYVNASTRFTDGFEFGFGAEIGISTQKLHARGPMGLKELTTTRYIIHGEGQIRG